MIASVQAITFIHEIYERLISVHTKTHKHEKKNDNKVIQAEGQIYYSQSK